MEDKHIVLGADVNITVGGADIVNDQTGALFRLAILLMQDNIASRGVHIFQAVGGQFQPRYAALGGQAHLIGDQVHTGVGAILADAPRLRDQDHIDIRADARINRQAVGDGGSGAIGEIGQ